MGSLVKDKKKPLAILKRGRNQPGAQSEPSLVRLLLWSLPTLS
jgi:hypothetical protein